MKTHGAKDYFLNNLFYFITLIIYFLANLHLLQVSDSIRLFSSTDPLDYINSAKSIIYCKDFAYLEINCLPKTWNTPGYPLFLALHMVLFEKFILYVVISQIILLLMTAYFSKKIISIYNKQSARWIFILILFNPNSFSTAHLIQTETLFTFLLVWVTYIIFFHKSIKSYLLLGVLCAGCAFVRPAFYYFCILSPILFFLISRYIHKYHLRKAILNSIITGSICLILVGSWVYRNNNIFDAPIFVSNTGFMVWANIEEMNKLNNNHDINFEKKYGEIMLEVENLPGYLYKSKQTPTSSKVLLEKSKEQLNLSFNSIFIAASKSLINLYFSGGGTNFERLLKGKEENYKNINRLYYGQTENKITPLKSILSLHMLPIIFSIAIKILALIGLFTLFTKRLYELITIISFPIIYLTPLYGFFGQSRFRVPLEPSFAMLGIIGILSIYAFLNKRKKIK